MLHFKQSPCKRPVNRIGRVLLVLVLALPMGCAVQSSATGLTPPTSISTPAPAIEVAFSPEGGAETLVLKVIGSARQSIRLAGYSFNSPALVKALMDAKRRGAEVRVLVDDNGNRSKASVAAMNLIVGAAIPIRVISAYAIHHDKYIVVDGRYTETGSFNYSQAAAKSNFENVIVVWNDPEVAGRYLAQWNSR